MSVCECGRERDYHCTKCGSRKIDRRRLDQALLQALTGEHAVGWTRDNARHAAFAHVEMRCQKCGHQFLSDATCSASHSIVAWEYCREKYTDFFDFIHSVTYVLSGAHATDQRNALLRSIRPPGHISYVAHHPEGPWMFLKRLGRRFLAWRRCSDCHTKIPQWGTSLGVRVCRRCGKAYCSDCMRSLQSSYLDRGTVWKMPGAQAFNGVHICDNCGGVVLPDNCRTIAR